ncbi:MAG: 50S ribosomal protein L29 [Kiritimatiellae bacterium]|nr:50S ribosomal protein L29 [Kiritimatiellia bacterium]MDD5522236.1 50S ribosomal protein L29 [Kiritimatiellia bacterium]
MKAAKIREHTDEELQQLMNDTVQQVFDLRAKKGTGDSGEHPLRVRLVRRELARIKTIIRERERKRNG